MTPGRNEDEDDKMTAASEEAVVSASPLDVSFVFLGTASMRPSRTRNVSGNALRVGGEWTIVDCGEGTQHRILDSKSVAPGRVNRIFVTHLHGDHCFGLPGLLCLLSNNSHPPPASDAGRGGFGGGAAAERVVQIVGPRGLRSMLRSTLLASATMTAFRFRVDELWPWDDAGDGSAGTGDDQSGTMGERYHYYASAFALPRHPYELDGLDVRPASRSEGARWEVPPHPSPGPMRDAWTISAAPLRHGIMCVGYAFRERPHAGKIDAVAARERVCTEENRAYQMCRGLKNPLALLGKLQRGESVVVMEGGETRTLHPADFLGPPRLGRTVAVLGDTSDSRHMAPLVYRADLLVHECTNAAVEADEDENEVLTLAASRGHSTPAMAGAFAGACGAQRLALTHFSSRYKGDESAESLEVMDAIAAQARKAYGRDNVVAARDLMEVEVPFGGSVKGRWMKNEGNASSGSGLAADGGPMSEVDAARLAADAANLYLSRAGLAV
mmetsp:Transcript_56244/g.168406  ORF Transcript_56244/g.168406 Transcript_56244/m.168406 type:complete len:498 (-) Transcript_56244:1320-2813(-)